MGIAERNENIVGAGMEAKNERNPHRGVGGGGDRAGVLEREGCVH